MAEFVAFQGYAPDLPPETPGIFTACDKVVPHIDGYVALYSPISAGIDALASAARGLVITNKLDGSTRMFAATQTKLYERSGTSWADVSQVGDYALGSDPENRARFAQFGNVTLAALGATDRIQASTTGDFADVSATAPKAKIIETVNNFVFVFNFVDDTHGLGTKENGWWCSAIGDETDWVPAVATQCVSGAFLETAGPVIAAKRLGSNIVAYKESSTFLGQYVGVPSVWDWRQLSGEIGTFCQESLVNVGTSHFFISKDDFYAFDGSRMSSIGTPVRKAFFDDLAPEYRALIFTAHDRTNSLIFWFYPSKSGGGTVDKCIVYNYKADKWGRADHSAEVAAEYIEPGITWDGLGTSYATWDDLPVNISYNSSYWTVEEAVVSFFNTSHTLVTFSGVPTSSSVTLGHYGDIATFSTVKRVRPRFLITPTASTLEHSYSNDNADNMNNGVTTTLTNNVYDLLWSARWHKFKLNFTGATKITGITGDYTRDGTE